MESNCWFCQRNEASQDYEYTVDLKKQDNRKDTKTVNIPRCEECTQKHRKGDNLALLMYLSEVLLVAMAYFVFNVELLYIALGYVALTRPLSSLSRTIRNKVVAPDKSVTEVTGHTEIHQLLEDGYVEKRRF